MSYETARDASPRLRAFWILRRLGVLRADFLGFSGADYVFRDREGRIWKVDLVIERVTMCVGIPPRITPA